jgi:hypothetical protein
MGELPRSRREPRAKLCLKNWKSTSVAQADFRQNVHTVRYCWMVGNSSLIRFRKSTLSSVRIGGKR